MKRLTNTIMKVRINYDFSLIESVRIKFKQGSKELEFEYPSDKVDKVSGENVLVLYWSQEDTAKFDTKASVNMDTFITLKDSDNNPETPIISFYMNPTLFEEGDFEEDD